MEHDLSLRGVDEKAPLATLCAMFDHAVATVPERVALRHFDAVLTYRELGVAVAALAQRLAAMVAPGEVVALVLPNSIEFPIAYFAALRAPATRDMVTGLASDLGISGVVCLGQDITVAPLVTEAKPAVGLRTALPADPAALLFSSGTTGLPKTVEHTHGRLVTAVRCAEYLWPTRTDGEVFLPIVPFSHIYGFVQGLLVPLSARGETVIPEGFQPEQVVELLARYRVTFFCGGPPAIYAGLLAAPNLGSADLSSLRVCPAGGAPFPVELMERWRRATGLEIYEGYGMSEMAPISGTTALTGVRPGSVGKPVPGT